MDASISSPTGDREAADHYAAEAGRLHARLDLIGTELRILAATMGRRDDPTVQILLDLCSREPEAVARAHAALSGLYPMAERVA